VDNRYTSDIINAIDILYALQQRKDVLSESSHNPISELITPEWHYSDSVRILDTFQIGWDSLEHYDLILTLADNVDKFKIKDGFIGGEFERSFCSLYQPYHYLPREKWGIHLRYDSLMRVAASFYYNCPSLLGRSIDSIKAAFLYLFIHELFHHNVENAASIIEIVLGKAHIYTKYYTAIYSEVFNSSNCIEEALSNSYLFSWAEECHIDRDFLKQELLKQGPGYNNFIHYVDSNFSEGIRILASQILYTSLNPHSLDPIEQVVNVSNPIEYCSIHSIPMWLHRKAKPVHGDWS